MYTKISIALYGALILAAVYHITAGWVRDNREHREFMDKIRANQL